MLKRRYSGGFWMPAAARREARVLEAAGGSAGGSIDEDGRRNRPEGGAVLDARWREARVLDEDTGSAEGPKRWHAIGGGGVGATAVVRAARAESQEGGVRRGIREGRRPVGDAFFLFDDVQ